MVRFDCADSSCTHSEVLHAESVTGDSEKSSTTWASGKGSGLAKDWRILSASEIEKEDRAKHVSRMITSRKEK